MTLQHFTVEVQALRDLAKRNWEKAEAMAAGGPTCANCENLNETTAVCQKYGAAITLPGFNGAECPSYYYRDEIPF